VPSVRQVVDSTYIGIVVGTLTALILVLVLITVLVLQRRRICKQQRLVLIPTLNGFKVGELYPVYTIEQTSSRPDGTPPSGSNVGLGVAHS